MVISARLSRAGPKYGLRLAYANHVAIARATWPRLRSLLAPENLELALGPGAVRARRLFVEPSKPAPLRGRSALDGRGFVGVVGVDEVDEVDEVGGVVRDGDLLGVKEVGLVLPVQTSRGNPGVRQPIERPQRRARTPITMIRSHPTTAAGPGSRPDRASVGVVARMVTGVPGGAKAGRAQIPVRADLTRRGPQIPTQVLK
jgi:hypothetical protein